MIMSKSPVITARIPPELTDAARAGLARQYPELAGADASAVLRAGLALLAGLRIPDVIGDGQGRKLRLPQNVT